MTSTRRLFAAALAVTAPHWALSAGAAAQDGADTPQAGPDITGFWTFETAPYHDGTCVLSGDMLIRESDPGVYTCEFSARESCLREDGIYDSKQVCRANRNGPQLIISSRVVEVSTNANQYWPDNFIVTVQSDDLMTGMLESFADSAVRFERGDVPIS